MLKFFIDSNVMALENMANEWLKGREIKNIELLYHEYQYVLILSIADEEQKTKTTKK